MAEAKGGEDGSAARLSMVLVRREATPHRLEKKWLRKEELYVAVNREVSYVISGAQGPGPKARDPIGA
mgnify:CR=1 FL=1